MRIVILGAPGSGKRTQTALVAEKYGLSSVMTGELVKSAVLERTPLGIEIKELHDAGRVVTEDIILALLREQLLKRELQAGFILDGFPRNLLQALTLDELMIEIDQPLDLILLIDIETDTLMERLVGRRTCRSCGLLYNIYRNPPVVDGVCDACGGRLHLRSDDNEETVSNRIHVFDHLISPLITHYEKQSKLIRIDGNGEIGQVFQLICKAINGGSRAEAPIERQSVTEECEEKRDESLVAEEAGDWSAAEDVISASAVTYEIEEKKRPTQSNAVKKVTNKKTVAKPTVKKQAGKNKPVVKKKTVQTAKKKTAKKKLNTQPVPVSRAVKKKPLKKKLNKKKAAKAKAKAVSKKKVSSKKLPRKTKAKAKTGSAKKNSKTAAKHSRTSALQSGKVVKKSEKKKAKKRVTNKVTVKKKLSKKTGPKKVKAKKSAVKKSALKKGRSKARKPTKK
jgi:adenylate kinase